jgi:hypothetical protein
MGSMGLSGSDSSTTEMAWPALPDAAASQAANSLPVLVVAPTLITPPVWLH